MLVAKTYHFRNQCLGYTEATLIQLLSGPTTQLSYSASKYDILVERIKRIGLHILNTCSIPLAFLSYALGQLTFSAALLSEKAFFQNPSLISKLLMGN